MPNLEDRDTQTKVKHEILGDYLIKWGSIITTGLKGHYARFPNYRPNFKVRFLYVDYFSFSGAYREDGNTVYGSPVIGVKALDEIKQFFIAQTDGLTPTTAAILFEEDGNRCDQLIDVLQAQGYGNRLKRTDDFSTLRDGDIAVVKADSSLYVDRVLKFIDLVNPTYSFHFIDPYGAGGVEKINIEKIVSKKGADCIINMMLNYFSRWISVATKATLNPTEQTHADSLDKFYGSNVWREISQKVKTGLISRQQAELMLAAAFHSILRGADKELSVKQIPLKFQDRDQTLYYLFLTTHDPTGAITMNEVIADARIREYDYRTEKRKMKTQPEQSSFFNLFNDLPDQKRPAEPQVDIDLLADRIYDACKTRTLQYREILREMVDFPYFLEDIKAAVVKLREQKRVSFAVAPSRINNNTEVKFA